MPAASVFTRQRQEGHIQVGGQLGRHSEFQARHTDKARPFLKKKKYKRKQKDINDQK